MTTNDAAMAMLSVLAGMSLGSIFFAGLWWTVRRAMTTPNPALLVLGSMLGRTAAVVAGFYLVSGGQWQRLVLCLVGFILARMIATRLLPKTVLPGSRAA